MKKNVITLRKLLISKKIQLLPAIIPGFFKVGKFKVR